jgi:predicted CoA-binding protein
MDVLDVDTLIRTFIGERVWAVVGVSADRTKYGHKIFVTLRNAGYTVYGINLRGGEVDGQRLYPSLAELPEKPDVVDLVVPPAQTEEVVRQCAALGLSRVWMQPGSESEAAIRFCHEHGIQVVHGACAMIHRQTWPA